MSLAVGDGAGSVDRSFCLAAATLAIVSLPFGAASVVASLVAAKYNVNALSQPLIILRAGSAAAEWWRWSLIFDLLGYYLLIVPLTLCLRNMLRPRNPGWVDLFALCLLIYSLIGAIGAAVLAAVTPPLIDAYSAATPSQRTILEVVSTTYSNAVYRGLWNLLEVFVAGFGWIGFGYLLGVGRRPLGIASVVLGVACLVDALGSALKLNLAAMTGLSIYLVLAPIWGCWAGISLLRHEMEPDGGSVCAQVRGQRVTGG
jgi:hypothetical protein